MTESSNETKAKNYAVRRLNPFLGVIQICETPDARALSSDGVSWELQVLAERPEHTWRSVNQGCTRKQFFRFGTWRAEVGMRQVAVNPLLDIGAMLKAANRLLNYLPSAVTDQPFDLADKLELWLLDFEQQPLALLASTTEQRFTKEIQEQDWRATAAKTSFVAPSMSASGAGSSGEVQRHHAAALEAQIANHAGKHRQSRWFARGAQGQGTPLTAPKGMQATPMAANAFPQTGLRERWSKPAQQRLLDDYLDWMAPRLLTLPSLTAKLRDRLEKAARSQAGLVEANHRLYPKVLNPDILEAARVEVRLRNAASG